MRFRKLSQIEPVPMQLAPMIDILFLLLMFFIITFNSAQQETEIDIAVPAADEGKPKENSNIGEIIVNVKKDGTVVVEGQQLTQEQLLSRLQLIASVHKDQAVILRSDENSYYKFTMNVLNTCQKAGIWNVSFATREPEKEGETPSAPK